MKQAGTFGVRAAAFVVLLPFTALFVQASAPAKSQVRQLAYEQSPQIAGTPVYTGNFARDLQARPGYRDNVYVASGPELKSKRTVDIAFLPKWSPDGQKLAFLAPCQAWFQCVEVANEDGSHRIRLARRPTKVSGESMSAINLAWSPSGNEIAYVEEGQNAWTIVSVAAADGTVHKEIDRQKCLVVNATLDWSPDGKKLAFGSCSGSVGKPDDKSMVIGDATITVADVSTGATHVIAQGVEPLWSPDGEMLLFVNAGLKLINADGTRQRTVLDGELALFGVTWLPSGRGVVFGSARETGRESEIFRINLDGTGVQKMASAAARGLSFAFPIVSPDEQRIIVSADPCSDCALIRSMVTPPAISLTKDETRNDPTPDVLLIDLATGHERILANGFHPSAVWDHK